jgi:hypothetical protein
LHSDIISKSWEQGEHQDPFYEEVGYWIWDVERQQVMKQNFRYHGNTQLMLAGQKDGLHHTEQNILSQTGAP